jgi:hypothetical protein
VLRRHGRSDEEAGEDYAKILLNFAKLSHNQRVDNKIAAQHRARLADWNVLIKNYIDAHNKAFGG